MYITDAGGQPEFFDIIPLLFNGPTFSIIFLSLDQPLTSYFNVAYRHKHQSTAVGRLPKSIEYLSSCTPLDMLQQVLASVESLNKSPKQQSGAFIIATHLDKIKISDRKRFIKTFEDEIRSAIKNASFNKEGLLRCFQLLDEFRLLFPLDNQNGDREEINRLRQVLTEAIEYVFHEPIIVPTSWGFFHVLLRHTHESNGICSLEEATRLAGSCGIHDPRKVREVLNFIYTHFGTIFYFGDVPALEDTVICDPNLLFHPITKLIAESFGANPMEQQVAETIRKTGEISWNTFQRICRRDTKTKGIRAEKVVEVLKHMNIISEIHNGDIRLFMSILLHPFPEFGNIMKAEYIVSLNPSPLVITFHPSRYQPVGLYHILLAQLLRRGLLLDDERYRNMGYSGL